MTNVIEMTSTSIKSATMTNDTDITVIPMTKDSFTIPDVAEMTVAS